MFSSKEPHSSRCIHSHFSTVYTHATRSEFFLPQSAIEVKCSCETYKCSTNCLSTMQEVIFFEVWKGFEFNRISLLFCMYLNSLFYSQVLDLPSHPLRSQHLVTQSTFNNHSIRYFPKNKTNMKRKEEKEMENKKIQSPLALAIATKKLRKRSNLQQQIHSR